MIEQGICNLLTTNITGVKVFPVQLPKDFVASSSNSQAIVYRSILSTPLYAMNGQNALTKWEVQIDCHGFTMANAINLAHSIKTLLSGGWRGTLTDADTTVVLGIFQLPGQVDGFNDTNRTYVRSLEYEVQYYAQ